MIVPPVDFLARYTSGIQKTISRPSTIIAYSKNTVPSLLRGSSSSSPFDCLAQLEEVRSMALRTQDKIQLLWIASTHNTSPARSALPSLELKDTLDPTFRRLLRLIHNFNHSLNSWVSTNLRFEVSGTFKINIVCTILEREQGCLAHFLRKWKELVPCLQHAIFIKIAWSKEVHGLLESALRIVQRLQDQLDDVHHSLHEFLEPQRTSKIQPMPSAFVATSASNGLRRHEAWSGLRRRGRGSGEGSHEILSSREGRYLLDERTTMR